VFLSDEQDNTTSFYMIPPGGIAKLDALRVHDTNGVFLAQDTWGAGHTLVHEGGGTWVDIQTQGPKGLVLNGMAWGWGFVGLALIIWATIKGLRPNLPNTLE